MRRLIAALVAALYLTPALAAVAHVQGNTFQTFTAASTTAVTLGAAVGNGDAVVGIVSAASGVTLTSVTDDKSNTYTILDSHDNAGNVISYTFIRGNITNGPTTITATWSSAASGHNAIQVDEYSGVIASTNPIDNSGAAHAGAFAVTGTATNGATSGSVTTVTNGAMIWGATHDQIADANNASVGTGFTLRQTASIKGITEEQLQSTAGAIAATFTYSVSTSAFNAVIALKPAGGGATVVPSRTLVGVGQ